MSQVGEDIAAGVGNLHRGDVAERRNAHFRIDLVREAMTRLERVVKQAVKRGSERVDIYIGPRDGVSKCAPVHVLIPKGSGADNSTHL